MLRDPVRKLDTKPIWRSLPIPDDILKWCRHPMTQACNFLLESSPVQTSQVDGEGFDLDKYLMRTYKATVKVNVKVNEGSKILATEIRAPNAQDARSLLWAI